MSQTLSISNISSLLVTNHSHISKDSVINLKFSTFVNNFIWKFEQYWKLSTSWNFDRYIDDKRILSYAAIRSHSNKFVKNISQIFEKCL